MTDRQKITDGRRRRRAVVYVRQSTPTHVQEHGESRARPVRAQREGRRLGRPASAVSLVDEDLGRSGAWADGRIGFRELLAEVGLGHVGLVLALEVARLARSSADWQQLVDPCVLTGTLIAETRRSVPTLVPVAARGAAWVPAASRRARSCADSGRAPARGGKSRRSRGRRAG